MSPHRRGIFRSGFAGAALFLMAGPGLFAQSDLQVTGGLDNMLDNYLTGIAKGEWEARAARVAAIKTAAQVRERQAYIHQKLLEEIGGFPEKTPLHARITGTLDRGDYKVEKLIYESQPHFYVTADLFVPAHGTPPYPALIGTAGHTAEGKAYPNYQRVWMEMAKRGFVVLAYDPPGQGERLEYLDPASGKSRLGAGTGEHFMAGAQCLLTGTNLARYFVWDGIRGVDYLLTRPDVDSQRIAVAGNSGGGTQSAYLMAFEPRLAAAAPSCYLTSWETLWAAGGPQDAEQDFVNFLKDGLDFPDFLIAFAPKPAQMATATRDFFPIAGARATFAEAHRIFEVMDAGAHMGYFEFDDTHGWSLPRRQATYRWLSQWLLGRQEDGAEEDGKLDPVEDLQVTPTGQVATSFRDAETVQSLNAALARQLYARRGGAGGKNLAPLIRARLEIAVNRDGAPQAEKRGEIERQGYRIEKIAIQPEAGITVPALAFIPGGGAARKPAVLYVNSSGKAADAGEGGAIEQMVRQGKIVLAVDPRGWGEAGGDARRARSSATRALLVGKTMAGMQTADLLRAFDYLAARPDVDRSHISAVGKGNGGVLVLYAAALEPRIRQVTSEGAPESYLAIAEMKTHSGITDILVPGVLRDFDLPDIRQALGARWARASH